MSMMRWDPFRDLLSIQDEMNQLFSRTLGRGGEGETATRRWAPPVDIAERKDAYVITAEVPGVEPEEIQVSLEDGALTIAGEREQTQESSDEQFHRVERRYGAFRRSIMLPRQVKADAIGASYDNGVLTVVVPKAEEAKPKKISVQPSGASSSASSGASGSM